MLHCQNKVFNFCEARTGKVLTTASSSVPSEPSEFFYDRNLFVDESNNGLSFSMIDEYLRHDRLFVIMPDAKVALFTTSENPCVEGQFFEVQVTSMTVCRLDAKPVYCCASPLGELFFYDYAIWHSRAGTCT
jgi:hypothetical protein